MPLKTLKELVAEAQANVGHISPDELTETEQSVVLIDVRDEPDYDEEHLPEAVSLPRGYLELDIHFAGGHVDMHVGSWANEGYLPDQNAYTWHFFPPFPLEGFLTDQRYLAEFVRVLKGLDVEPVTGWNRVV